ncbi:uncharacterized protein LOC122509611 isoform X2 [Leptopilina heterotoma]|uniref:uncharacterized protein LOC122509611 isoform X2 n=1 Tax=Leptopilina heterotoma TaxID=63436 RepID=UPI001CA9172F|nr:uncharacterized protein LOC122509611 isoform X2 [Leptopilina heterotoma]
MLRPHYNDRKDATNKWNQTDADMEAFNSHMKICKFFSSSMGLWPQQSKLTQKLISIFVWLTLTSFFIPLLLSIKNIKGNLDMLIPWLANFFGLIAGACSYANACNNRKKIKLFISKMKNDWLNCESTSEYEIMLENASLNNNLIKVQLVLYCAAMLKYISEPIIPLFLDIIIPLDESRPRKLIAEANYLVDADDTFNFIVISINEIHVTVAAVVITMTVDTIFIFSAYHACGQLQILGYKFKNLVNADYNVAFSDKRDTQKEIKFCIKMHKSTIMFINDFNDCFSIPLFLNLGLTMLMMSLAGVQFVTKLDNLGEAFTMMSYTIGQICRLFCLTLPSQRLIDQSNELFQNIYDSYWYTLPSDSKTLVKTVMLRCLIPNSFTAGKLYCFSMSNFVTVIKTAVSYITVLLSIRE